MGTPDKPLSRLNKGGKTQHLCTWGGHNIYYDCDQCNNDAKWACSVVNEDEDAHLCDRCLELIAEEMYDSMKEEV